MNKVTLYIDGRELTAPEGEKLLFIALENDIYIAHLCAVKEEGRPSACCRLCFVEVDGRKKPVTACAVRVSDGMKVSTRTPAVDRLVRTAFELLLSDHRLDCDNCPKNKSCALQKIAGERGLKLGLPRLNKLEREYIYDDSAEKLTFDSSRCVLCGKCIAADKKIEAGAIGFAHRGLNRRISTFYEGKLADSTCKECLLCVKACPVGALY
ncbi:2Fe-2S iron-sulfur cluster-binding protein [Dethiobacter alkaliphilus]|uniref:Ferredoxin n=1 Tax=Dethiobacter alkaliphilus AHT 1 TaxID=555088 RepID=C0GER9_DETAL|nr:2Fe-2S iron-sulfur cluster-binding protein [Dethiobacter alkaliphilus]EEG78101.1 ferredoxin [Dethiobacter alkaliphilus AHT 1]